MNQTTFIALLGMIFLASCQPSSKTETDYTLFQGATLYDGNGNSISESKILIKDGLIEAVGGPEMETPDDAEVINLSGKFITPGLVDAHVHFSQTGFFDGRPDALDIRDTLRYDSLQAKQKKSPNRYFETYFGRV